MALPTRAERESREFSTVGMLHCWGGKGYEAGNLNSWWQPQDPGKQINAIVQRKHSWRQSNILWSQLDQGSSPLQAQHCSVPVVNLHRDHFRKALLAHGSLSRHGKEERKGVRGWSESISHPCSYLAGHQPCPCPPLLSLQSRSHDIAPSHSHLDVEAEVLIAPGLR